MKMENTNIEKKTSNTYVRVPSNMASSSKKLNLAGQDDSNNNKGSQKIKMNPINYWCGPHFLFHIM